MALPANGTGLNICICFLHGFTRELPTWKYRSKYVHCYSPLMSKTHSLKILAETELIIILTHYNSEIKFTGIPISSCDFNTVMEIFRQYNDGNNTLVKI